MSHGSGVVRWSAYFVCAVVLLIVGASRAYGDGASDYKAKCASCHAADGSGDTPAGKMMKVVDLRSAEVQKMTDAQQIDATTNGKGKMPAYKDKLSADQIKAVVAYIRTLAKK